MTDAFVKALLSRELDSSKVWVCLECERVE